MCTDTMEMKSTPNNILQSYISDKNILFIEPGNTLYGFNFSGINIQTEFKKVSNICEIEKYKNQYFDYIIIHGFLLRDFEREYKINKIEKLLSCNNFVIDMMGEGDGLGWMLNNFDNIINKYFIFNKIKYLGVLPHYHGFENKLEKWDFFKYNFGGPKIFCSPNNVMIHREFINDDGVIKKSNNQSNNQNIVVTRGIKYSTNQKTKIYSCLNNQNRIHRAWVIDSLIKKNLIEYGYVSNLNGGDFPQYRCMVDGYVSKYKINNPILKIDEPTNFFGIHYNIDSDCYINLVNETSPREFPFMTEKSVKPFYTLQFPIIFGYSGIVDELRSYGFDMFDDFINHDYDTIELKLENSYNDVLFNTYLKIKSDKITSEIERLCNLDIHSFYLESKERLIHNQKLLYELTVTNNTILKDIGYWLFGNSIYFTENINFETVYSDQKFINNLI